MNKTKISFLILAAVCTITVFLAFMLPNIVMDNELRHFFPESHQSYKRFNSLTDDFGDQYAVDIVIETQEETILSKENIEVIKNITDILENSDNVANIKSITSVDFITDEDGHLSTGKLIPEEFSGTKQDIQNLKKRILEWPAAYIGTVISSNFKGIQIIVTIKSDMDSQEISKLYYEIVSIVEENLNNHKELNYKIAGEPVLSEYAKIFMHQDLKNLIPLITAVVLLCLFLSFHNLEGTLLPLLSVLISTIWTAGIMALIKEPLTIVSSCLPVLLIAVGSAYGIHIINYYYRHLEKQELITSIEEHQEIVSKTVKSAFAPVMLAGITTIAGFISTITSPIKPLKSFAVFSAFGIIIALMLAFLFIPAILMIKPVSLIQKQQKNMNIHAMKKNARLARLGANSGGSLLDKIYSYLNKRESAFVLGLILIVGISAWSISKLNIESAFLEYFPKNSKLRSDVTSIDNKYIGTTGFSFIISGQEKGSLCNPEILKQMDKMEIFLKSKHPEIGAVLSFTEFVKRMNQVMHAGEQEIFAEESSTQDIDSFFFEDLEETAQEISNNDGKDSFAALEKEPLFAIDKKSKLSAEEIITLFSAAYASSGKSGLTLTEFIDSLKRELNFRGAAYYEIPYDISKYPVNRQEELKNVISQYLFLYSGSLDSLLDEQLEPSKSRMQLVMRTHDTGKIKSVIEDAQSFAENHFPKGYTLEAAGLGELETAMTSMIISSQISSLILAVVIVFCILAIFYRSPAAGVIGAIPLGISILMNFGIMSLTGINLDMVTSLVAAIAIGIGIDYTVHFMNNYHNERILSSDLTQVTLKTIRHSGKGIVVNAFSVGCGFLVMCFSKFVVLKFVGFLVAVVMFTSSAAALTILPVLLNMIKPAFMSKKIMMET